MKLFGEKSLLLGMFRDDMWLGNQEVSLVASRPLVNMKLELWSNKDSPLDHKLQEINPWLGIFNAHSRLNVNDSKSTNKK